MGAPLQRGMDPALAVRRPALQGQLALPKINSITLICFSICSPISHDCTSLYSAIIRVLTCTPKCAILLHLFLNTTLLSHKCNNSLFFPIWLRLKIRNPLNHQRVWRSDTDQMWHLITTLERKWRRNPVSAGGDWWGSREQQRREEAEERVDKKRWSCTSPPAYRLKTSRCSSAAEFTREEMKTPPTRVSKQKSYLRRGPICPPCELLHCGQHGLMTQTAAETRNGCFWSPFCLWIILHAENNDRIFLQQLLEIAWFCFWFFLSFLILQA